MISRIAGAGVLLLILQSFPTPSLTAYYPLNETTVGTAADASGSGATGTHVDNPTPNPDVAPLVFNTPASRSLGFVAGGTATTGDRVTLPNSVVNGRTNLTATWWMKTAKTGQQAIVSGAASAAANNEYLLFFNSNTVFRYHDKGASFDTTIPSISDNVWHHVAAVRDDASKVVSIYTDGVLRGTNNTLALGALNVAAGGLVLGEEQDSVGGGFDANQSFVGLLDDVRFYSRVLSGAEVGYLAAGSGPPSAPSLTSVTAGFDPVSGQPRVDLAWSAVTTTPSTPITYTLVRGTTAGGPYPTTVASTTGTSATDTSVSFGTTYYYVVRATNVGGTSANSNERFGTPQPPLPRTNDHEEGLFEGGDCGCGTANPGSPWALVLAALLMAGTIWRR